MRKIFVILTLLSVVVMSRARAADDSNPTQDLGGRIFTQRCAACHNVEGADLVGPALKGVSQRRTEDWILNFVKSPVKMIQSGNTTAKELVKKYHDIIMPDQNLTDEEIKAVVAFVESGEKYRPTDEDMTAQGILPKELFAPEKPSKFPLLNDNEGYAPEQPIAFSHKLHAGDNGITCQYCHYGAEKSKNAGFPATSVCLNCHKVIKRDSIEIQKIHRSFEENESIEWVRVHLLPDFVYFSHERHVAGAEFACQTCHGPVEEMERLRQYSDLTMGWCVNCHRETEVDVHAKYYSSWSKKEEGMTVADMGGIDCVRCHY